MRTLILALCLTLVSYEAFAISRYQSRSMSCDGVQSTVSEQGAVILRYSSARNPSLPLYDRFVVNGGYCAANEYAKLTAVPASDTSSCPVLKCMPLPDDKEFFNN